MRRVRRQQDVPYTPEQMFALVNDVESYPQFMHWCRGSTIERATDAEVVATLEIGIGGLRKRVTTRNTLDRPRRITMDLVAGPFSDLRGNWGFEATPDGGCTVQLNLDFEVVNTPLIVLFATLFEELVQSQVAAFVSRADAVYGGSGSGSGSGNGSGSGSVRGSGSGGRSGGGSGSG